jgi:hypothetical protein
MYEKYDTFNICLNTVSICSAVVAGNAGTTANDKNVMVYLSGLPFISQTYSTRTNTLTNNTVIGSFAFPADTTTTTSNQYFYSSNIATFNKSCDIVNLTIELRRGLDDSSPASTNIYPQVNYIFAIYGVDPKPKLLPINQFNNRNNGPI